MAHISTSNGMLPRCRLAPNVCFTRRSTTREAPGGSGHHARHAHRSHRADLRSRAPLRPRSSPSGMTPLTPLISAAIAFAYLGGFVFVAVGVVLSVRRRRLH